MTQRTLGFIGLGVMGEPMCANLAAKSGARVLCHDLDAAPMRRLAERGAVPADSLRALAHEASVVFLCLASAQAAESVVEALAEAWQGSEGGRTVVDMGTTSVLATRRMAERLAQAGHRFVDAPVARMPAAAIAGTLSIMAGGTAEDVSALMPHFRCMGSDITHCGGTGAGQVVKILHNTVLFEAVQALAEAMAVARAHGVDGAVLLDAIELGSADSRAARVQGREALLPRHYPEGRFATRYALKDVSLALELAQAVGLEAAMARETAATLRRTIDAGWGDRYYPALYELVSGAPPRDAAND
ncbi:NAD(P)-dependent oxidoreductase [Variovorax sp.]|jgi:3-hydroxyisobutyrate dehydrogenase|uniref:NAD(P)-dependent oxidoreductase n=1 Tax=Variovorax sp. TaxID=1871043 RepID=UPI0012050BAB|nr:NAD(P)-dependent oxidoreductase [Variovorax sp.]TAJ59685.1 MAG: NAD(P)-dependent oxidoreductase [Variovorax sp.]